MCGTGNHCFQNLLCSVIRMRYTAFGFQFWFSCLVLPFLLSCFASFIAGDVAVFNSNVTDDIHCYTNDRESKTINPEWDERCYGRTFLVAKWMNSSLQDDALYPGVGAYTAGTDEQIHQHIYTVSQYLLYAIAFINSVPLIFLMCNGSGRVRHMTDVDGKLTSAKRVDRFMHSTVSNSQYSLIYVFCNLLTILSLGISTILLGFFLGPRYLTYGWDILISRMEASSFATPSDWMFPRFTKCEIKHYGFGGSIESRSVICHLPNNEYFRYLFGAVWYLILTALVVAIVSFIYLCLVWLFPCYRRAELSKMGKRTCGISRHEMIVNMDFGDWLFLSFLQKNLHDEDFTAFLQELIKIPGNKIIRRRTDRDPEKCIVRCFSCCMSVLQKCPRCNDYRWGCFDCCKTKHSSLPCWSRRGNCLGIHVCNY